MIRAWLCALGLLVATAADATDSLELVGTWSVVVSVERSTCKDQAGAEIARQWNISRKADGTYVVETAAPSSSNRKLRRSPLQGRVEGSTLTLRGAVVSEVDGSDAMINLALWELTPEGDTMSGSFLGSSPGEKTDVKGGNAHLVCAFSGSVRATRS